MLNEYDVIVVGAGPAGTTAARFAARGGVSVLVLEKDRDVGYPVRCGEAVSVEGVSEFVELNEKWIASKINKFSMIAPDGTEVILPLDEEGLILERRIFDYELAKLAVKEGAEVLTRAYVNGLIFENGKVSGVKFEFRGEQREVKAKIVIGADGVESRIGRWAGLQTHIPIREMESAFQVTASGIDNIDQNTCYFYFGREVAPEGYFWIFPKGNNTANIGLGVSGNQCKEKATINYLNKFMRENYPNASILTQVAGGVPCAVTLKKISAPGLMLAGDAARQVNPLSGGGIISGMIGGKIAGSIANKAIKENKLDLILTYDEAWAERLGKRHEIFNRIKEGIYGFTDEKFNSIAHSFLKTPLEKRSFGNLFKTALLNKPSLLIDVAKVFVSKVNYF